VQTGLSEPLQTDSLLHYELEAGKGLKVKVGLITTACWSTFKLWSLTAAGQTHVV
jgi:hypothetical protein